MEPSDGTNNSGVALDLIRKDLKHWHSTRQPET